MQFGIREILERNKIVPVATIYSLDDITPLIESLLDRGISCIEVTLRTPIAMEAIAKIKRKYGDKIDLGVGTLVNSSQLAQLQVLNVDFLVSPGLTPYMHNELQAAKIPFIPGVSTASEVMEGMNLGYDTFKLFPAEIVGGTKLIKTFGAIFPNVKFCPTGGINANNFESYLSLDNVICVGGSWVI